MITIEIKDWKNETLEIYLETVEEYKFKTSQQKVKAEGAAYVLDWDADRLPGRTIDELKSLGYRCSRIGYTTGKSSVWALHTDSK